MNQNISNTQETSPVEELTNSCVKRKQELRVNNFGIKPMDVLDRENFWLIHSFDYLRTTQCP